MRLGKGLFLWGVIGIALVSLSVSTQATLLYSDLFEYYDDGTIIQKDLIGGTSVTIRGPTGPAIHGVPTGKLLLKIEEDVVAWDAVSHPTVTPGQDRYVYTISNVDLDSGNVPLAPGNTPGVGVNGVSGFNIVNAFNIPTGLMGTPNDPVSGNPWVVNGFAPGNNWEWDIRPLAVDPNGGWGVGAPVAGSPLAMNGFWFEVAGGTPHGVVPMWVHSWDSTAGPSTKQVNIWNLMVSGPVPEPGTLALLALGSVALAVRRRRQSR